MNPTLLAAFDVSRIMPIYCRLMDVVLPAETEALTTDLQAKMMEPELIHAWNPQKVLAEIETFSLAVYEQTCLDDTLLNEGIEAFKAFTQAMTSVGTAWYYGSAADSYGDGEERWHFSILGMKIGSISLQLCPSVPNSTVVGRAMDLRLIEKNFESMMLALDASPYMFSSALQEEEYDEKDREVWSLTASATASFLEVVRKVNAELEGTTKTD